MQKFNKGSKPWRIAVLLGAAASIFLAAPPSQARGPKVNYLSDFYNAGLNAPGGALVEAPNGNMYGQVNFNAAEIYEASPKGAVGLAWSAQTEGNSCYNGMTLGTDGMLYGTCAEWGYNENASGIVFQFQPKKKTFKVIYTWPAFGNGGNEYPSPLTLGPDGNFYGTTHGDDTNPYGTVFKVTPQGTYTTLHVFQGAGQNDGAYPSVGSTEEPSPIPLTLGSDGNFYGTTDQGGVDGSLWGTIYQITPAGAVTILYSFPQGDGTYTGVVELNGNFYGQTTLGGTNDDGTIYELAGDGTFTTLHSFSKTSDNAAFPDFPFTIGNDGNLYDVSTDYISGGFGPESLYKITPSGTYTDLYNGFGAPDGCVPVANGCEVNSPLLLHTNGRFYGVTMKGPNCNECGGTFYRVFDRQAPFVRLLLPVAKPGQWLGILGQGFSKTTAVTFNGKATTFRVLEDTYLEARVPLDASKGRVSVKTANGEQRSNIDFSPLH